MCLPSSPLSGLFKANGGFQQPCPVLCGHPVDLPAVCWRHVVPSISKEVNLLCSKRGMHGVVGVIKIVGLV